MIDAHWPLFLAASVVVIATPGQDMLLVMSKSLAQGVRAGVATAAGVSLGLVAGFMGGWVDFLIARIFEVFTAIPQVLFALFLVAMRFGFLVEEGIAKRNPAMRIAVWISIVVALAAAMLPYYIRH